MYLRVLSSVVVVSWLVGVASGSCCECCGWNRCLAQICGNDVVFVFVARGCFVCVGAFVGWFGAGVVCFLNIYVCERVVFATVMLTDR